VVRAVVGMAVLLVRSASAYSAPRHAQGRSLIAVPLCAVGKEGYMSVMESLLTILIPLAMLATLAVLGLGVYQMIRGGNPRRSNKLMQYRVVLQGLALLLFAILMMMFKH
jgi:hypothetical protein